MAALKTDKVDHSMYSTHVIIYKIITNIQLCTLSTQNHLILVRVGGSYWRRLGENIRRRPGKLDWETTHPASGRSEVEFRSSNPIAIGPNIFLPTFETISGIINTFGDIHKNRVK